MGAAEVSLVMQRPARGVYLVSGLTVPFYRLGFMGLAWLLGIILTSEYGHLTSHPQDCSGVDYKVLGNVNYKYIFAPTPGQPQIQVFAGLAPVTEELSLTALLGSAIPSSVINFYYLTFLYSLLSDNRFSLAVPSISCSGTGCSSFFLPGGAAIIKDQDDDNFLFGEEDIDNNAAVLVNRAPGVQMEFYPPPADWKFDVDTDCAAFGQTEGEGLYMCLANSDTDIVVGKCALFRVAMMNPRLIFAFPTTQDGASAPLLYGPPRPALATPPGKTNSIKSPP